MKRKSVFPVILLVIAAAAWMCSTYLVQFALIQGDSMAPAYRSWEPALILRCVREYSRGDVVAFHCEGLHCDLVKRIAALPGDTVEIRENQLYVNGKISPWVTKTVRDPGTVQGRLVLQDGEYFVLGDNLDRSRDSRFPEVGIVTEEQILGKLWIQKAPTAD